MYTPLAVAPKRTAEECRNVWIEVARKLLEDMPPEQRARFDRLEDLVKNLFHSGMLNPWVVGHGTGSPDYFMNTVRFESIEDRIRPMASAFARVAKAARRCGAKTLVLSIPEGFYVNKEAFRNVQRIGFRVVPEMLASEAADEAVRRACERTGLLFHGVTEGFRARVDEPGLYFELDRHFTAAGNALYADLMAPLVAQDIGNAAR